MVFECFFKMVFSSRRWWRYVLGLATIGVDTEEKRLRNGFEEPSKGPRR